MRSPASLRYLAIILLCWSGLAGRSSAQTPDGQFEMIISVDDQKMVLLRDGGWIRKYKVSTSRFGLGDNYGSYKTPLGKMRVWEKLGGELPSGAVLKGRNATGEILPVNAPGRDPIVSRILWLEGLEAQNDNARGRGIYIHGTTEESNIGKPVSWGCIRMRSQDVIELYDLVPVGTMVTIIEGGLPRVPKWKPAPPVFIAANPPTPTTKVSPNFEAKTLPAESERPSPVAEMLRPRDERMVPADAGATKAFRGSILFAGLQPEQKAPERKAVQPPAVPPLPRATEPEAAPFTLLASSDAARDFSLEIVGAEPPLRLIDLRRVPPSPLLAVGSILEAPEPVFASTAAEQVDQTKRASLIPAAPSFR